MRRLRLMILATVIALLALETGAQGTPMIALTAYARHVPGFQHTGNIAGAGAEVEITIDISGTEYGGFPFPLTHLALSLPNGTLWNASGFPTCLYPPPEQKLGPHGPRCPDMTSARSPTQFAIAFGGAIAPEVAALETGYEPDGSLFFSVFGDEPVRLELEVSGRVVGTRKARTLEINFPLIDTMPNAQDASVTKLALVLGSGFATAGKPRFSLRIPKSCPSGALLYRVEAGFAGPTPQTVSARYKAPCPIGAHRH
jgi:hypothetical protein